MQRAEGPNGHKMVALDRLQACRGLRQRRLWPAGLRLFCARLENALGLRGRFCWRREAEGALIHDPIVLRLFAHGAEIRAARAACMSYPSHTRRQTKEAGLGIVEQKYITWDDVLCDLLFLTNHTESLLPIRIEAEIGATRQITRAGHDLLAGSLQLDGERVFLMLAMPTTRPLPPETLRCEIELAPGESTSVLIALAVSLQPSTAQAALKRWTQAPEPLAQQQKEREEWEQTHCPTLLCADERWERLWRYRWLLLQHNLMQLLLPEGERLVFCEAREGPLSAVRLAAAPLILQEARWLRRPQFAHSYAWSVLSLDSANEEPITKEWLPSALWGLLQIWPDEQLHAAAAEWALQRLSLLQLRCDPDHDLLLVGGQGLWDMIETAQRPTIIAVDHSAMHAASLHAAGEMLLRLGREIDGRWHLGQAERCRQAILQRLWDDWDQFFYDQQAETGEAMHILQASGFAPFAFRLVPDEAKYKEALAKLTDPQHFWGERLCPLVSPSAAQSGEELLGAQLISPALNSLLAEALAYAIRALSQPYISRRHLADFLYLFGRLQLEGEGGAPNAREAYDRETGAGLGASDCLQSCFNDLIIRHFVGLTPRPDDILEIDPLASGWDWFALLNVPYRGHSVSVIWDRRPQGKRFWGAPEGLSVYVDGMLVAAAPQLERITTPLPPSPQP